MTMPNSKPDNPRGELTIRTLAMPGDTNAAGDIFGGWVMAQMDLACGIRGAERAGGRIVTAAVNEMSFASPVKVGDTLSIYSDIEKIGNSSMVLYIEAWAQRYLTDVSERVTFARFTMVAIDTNGKPTKIPPLPK
ncbi:acyl-CoA thioesterase [Ahrensia kielensis]|uniref:Acyl-CoA thioesterase n=1 Tax=Ahrensia kielensis TaxID=76980 RepID=A0ABU9T6W6_9HYPH|nr:acyl-CoA thioesterase [Ahrensia sp. 13_GOM-1096m]